MINTIVPTYTPTVDLLLNQYLYVDLFGKDVKLSQIPGFGQTIPPPVEYHSDLLLAYPSVWLFQH